MKAYKYVFAFSLFFLFPFFIVPFAPLSSNCLASSFSFPPNRPLLILLTLLFVPQLLFIRFSLYPAVPLPSFPSTHASTHLAVPLFFIPPSFSLNLIRYRYFPIILLFAGPLTPTHPWPSFPSILLGRAVPDISTTVTPQSSISFSFPTLQSTFASHLPFLLHIPLTLANLSSHHQRHHKHFHDYIQQQQLLLQPFSFTSHISCQQHSFNQRARLGNCQSACSFLRATPWLEPHSWVRPLVLSSIRVASSISSIGLVVLTRCILTITMTMDTDTAASATEATRRLMDKIKAWTVVMRLQLTGSTHITASTAVLAVITEAFNHSSSQPGFQS